MIRDPGSLGNTRGSGVIRITRLPTPDTDGPPSGARATGADRLAPQGAAGAQRASGLPIFRRDSFIHSFVGDCVGYYAFVFGTAKEATNDEVVWSPELRFWRRCF